MQGRSERKKLFWAILASLLLHFAVGISIASFGDKLQPSLPEEEKPVELTIVDLAPTPPPVVQKNTMFVDTPENKQSKEEPTEKTFESNANSIAASQLPALGNAPVPTQEGKDRPTMDLETHAHSLGQPGAPPQPEIRPTSTPVPVTTPTSAPSASATATPQPTMTPSATPPPTPEPSATPNPELLAMFRATPPPTVSAPEEVERTPTPPVATPTPTERPTPEQPRSSYRREETQSRMRGNISNRGVSSVNAAGTPLGRYEKMVYDSIGARWYSLCDANRDRIDIGTVHVQFVVTPNGKITSIKLIGGGTSESFSNLCLQSVQDAKPPPIPEDVIAALPSEGLAAEVSFTGYQNH
jgi:TonB family protein